FHVTGVQTCALPIYEVVEDRAALVARDRVQRAAVREAAEVVRDQPIDGRDGIGTGHLELAHVRDVEQTRAGAHGLVLDADPGVLDRHVVAGEGHELRAEAPVFLVKGRGSERGAHGAGGSPTRGTGQSPPRAAFFYSSAF